MVLFVVGPIRLVCCTLRCTEGFCVMLVILLVVASLASAPLGATSVAFKWGHYVVKSVR